MCLRNAIVQSKICDVTSLLEVVQIHDNARSYTATALQHILTNFDWEQFDHFSYSSALTIFMYFNICNTSLLASSFTRTTRSNKSFQAQAVSFYNWDRTPRALPWHVSPQWQKLAKQQCKVCRMTNCFSAKKPSLFDYRQIIFYIESTKTSKSVLRLSQKEHRMKGVQHYTWIWIMARLKFP